MFCPVPAKASPLTWLIVFVAVALILAPVMWMMPTQAQKRQVVLRERARKLGLMVNIIDLPQSHRSKVRKEPPSKGVSYTLRTARQKGLQRPCWILWREQPVDEPDTGATPPPAILALRDQLPADAVALESTELGYSIYWRERGEAETVDAIAGVLNRAREVAGGEIIGH